MALAKFYVRTLDLFKEFMEKKISPTIMDTQVWTQRNIVQPGNFIHNVIVDDIHKKMKWEVECSWKFEDVQVNMIVLYKRKIDIKLRHNYLIFMVNLIIYILNRRIGSEQKTIPKTIKLLLIHCSRKKVRPIDCSRVLTNEHVNSGYSYTSNIVVYREEEMTKVLIHEMIHLYNNEQNIIDLKDEGRINKYFGIDHDFKSVTMNESFTDSHACLLNIALYTIFSEKNTIDDFVLNFKKEKMFIMKQAQFILYHFQYKIGMNGAFQLKNKSLVQENTHCISYYILKAIMFYKITYFLKYLYKYQGYLNDPKEYEDLVLDDIESFGRHLKKIKQDPNSRTLMMTHLDVFTLM